MDKRNMDKRVLPKIGIVILNYNKYEETIKYVESIERQASKNYVIFIVDNGSENKSFAELKKRYEKKEYIRLISSEKNIGFSKGMNLGIEMAEKEDIDFVLISNSDIILNEENAIVTLLNVYRDGVGVISPILYNEDLSIQEPYWICNGSLTKKTLISCLELMMAIMKAGRKKKDSVKKKVELSKEELLCCQYIIQGPLYLLTPDFFCFYKKLYPHTFLYGEERNLNWYIKKAGLTTVCVDAGVIIHAEGASTPDNTKKSMRKYWFSLKSAVCSFPMWIMPLGLIKKLFN